MKRYRTWFKNTTDPLLLLSTDKVLKVNQAAVKLLGYDTATQLLKVKPEKLLNLPVEGGRLNQMQLKQAKQSLRENGSCHYDSEFFPTRWIRTPRRNQPHRHPI